jgi:hypothetical protein
VAPNVDSREFFIGDFDPLGVFPLIQFSTHCKTSFSGGARDQLDDCSIAAQWFATSVDADERKQAMLNLIPFAGTGRHMANGNRKLEFIG